MARPPRTKRDKKTDSTDESNDEVGDDATAEIGGSAASNKTLDSPMKLWIDEHWHGWAKPVSGIFFLALAYIAYSQHWIGEGLGGPLMVLVVVGGGIAAAALPTWQAIEGQRNRGLFAAFVGVWAIAAGYGPLRAALPKTELAQKKLGETKDHLNETVSLPSESGPYELFVGGNLKGNGDVEAPYRITVTGEGDASDEVTGAIKRTFVSQRISRKGGTTTQRRERTENVHRLEHAKGHDLKLALEGADDQLEDGLTVTVLRAGLPPFILLTLAALCVLVGLFIDYKLATNKTKTYLTMAAGFVLYFAWDYPRQATPHFLVPPAVGSAVEGFIIGGLGGALAGFIGRQMKPQSLMKVKGVK